MVEESLCFWRFLVVTACWEEQVGCVLAMRIRCLVALCLPRYAMEAINLAGSTVGVLAEEFVFFFCLAVTVTADFSV